jgi:16S rRNA (adenine1518-N6/adenine1519-N6)-dimethyltransferase
MNKRVVEGHFARKRFGQNFLTDQSVIERIVHGFGPVPGQNVVEIGPGLGALTTHLLPALGHLQVVELDRDLAARLPVTLAGKGELTIHEGDALKFDFSTLATGPGSLRVIGNLPYNISTPLIFHLLSQAGVIADMHFMLQKEVVDRMCAEPGTSDYGRLSVMLQYRCRVDFLFGVPPGAFSPPPKVDSAIVRITPYMNLPYTCADENLLQQVVAAAFSMRRKTIRNSLRAFADNSVLEALGVDLTLRPEALSVADYVNIANGLSSEK